MIGDKLVVVKYDKAWCQPMLWLRLLLRVQLSKTFLYVSESKKDKGHESV